MRDRTNLPYWVTLFFLVLLAVPFGTALAQSIDLSGNWQGTLQLSGSGGNAGRALRIVLKIAKTPDGSLSAINYSIDQSAEGAKATNVSLQADIFRYSVPSLGGSYEGKLSKDGNSIVGKWAGTLPLVFVRSSKATAWEIPEPLPALKPMTATDPSFEVATVKPTDPEKPGKYIRVVGRKWMTHDTSLAELIQVAYGLHARQIVGGPQWVRTEKFDLTGSPDAEGEPNGKQWLLMVQKLLPDRFGLVARREKQELSSYVLRVASGGPRNLTPSQSSNPSPCCLEFRSVPGGLLLPPRNATMGQFAQMMQQVVLDRPMVDQTGLNSRFDFDLRFMPDETQFNGHPPKVPDTDAVESAPSLVEALQRQLGLKLTVEKIPTDVLVIVDVHEPSPN